MGRDIFAFRFASDMRTEFIRKPLAFEMPDFVVIINRKDVYAPFALSTTLSSGGRPRP
jgi:hypothetical protein